jgi:hypothetical protein
MKKRISIFRIINKMASGEKLDLDEEIYINRGKDQFSNVKGALDGPNIIALPSITRSTLETFGLGVEPSPIFAVEDYAGPLKEMGVTFLQSQYPLKNLPVPSGMSGEWMGETEENTESSDLLNTISFSAFRVSKSQPVSKQLILQGGPDVEQILIDRMLTGVMNKVMLTLFGKDARTAKKPQGLGYKITTGALTKHNAISPYLGDLVTMEKELADADTPIENMAYITNLAGRNILKSKPREAGLSSYLMDDQNRVNGWPCYVSNAVTKVAGDDDIGNLLVFGNWKDLILTQFGGWLLIVDPYSQAKANKLIISISGYFDWKGARGSLATSNDESTDVDEFAYSFASRAIKA